MNSFIIKANYIDILNKKIYSDHITIKNGTIASINKTNDSFLKDYILPGFIDFHIYTSNSISFCSFSSTVATLCSYHK